MKVRVLTLFLLVILVLPLIKAEITEPGRCFTGFVGTESCSGNICEYRTSGLGDPNIELCGSGLTCQVYNRNAYCIPEENGCVVDADCNNAQVCNTETYICDGVALYNEICATNNDCISGLVCNGASTCSEPTPVVNQACTQNYECGDLVCEGTCVEPTLTNGYDDSFIFDSHYIRGDFVTFWDTEPTISSLISASSTLCTGNQGSTQKLRKIWYGKIDSAQEVRVKTGVFDDYVGLAVYDETGAQLNEIPVYRHTFSGGDKGSRVPDFVFTLNPGWYRFVFSFADQGGDSVCNINFDKALINVFSEIDSGFNFQFHEDTVSEFDEGLAGYSFYLSPKEWEVIRLPFEVGGFVTSCERENPLYTYSNDKIYIRAQHSQGDPALCNVFAWSKENENNNVNGINFLFQNSLSTDSRSPDEFNIGSGVSAAIASCNSDNNGFDEIAGGAGISVWRNKVDDKECGMITFESNNDALLTRDLQGGKIGMLTKTISSNRNYESNPEPFTFQNYEIAGAIVRCSEDPLISTRVGSPRSRYNIVGETVYVYSTPGTECTVMAWQSYEDYVPGTIYPEPICPPCNDATNEGRVCMNGDFVAACVYNYDKVGGPGFELVNLYSANLQDNPAANKAYPVPYQQAITEGRDDIVSDYSNFYQCSVVGDRIIPPPSTETCNGFMTNFFNKEIAVCGNGISEDCCSADTVFYDDLGACIDSCKILNDDAPGYYDFNDACTILESYGLSCTNDNPVVTECNLETGNCDDETFEDYTEACLSRTYPGEDVAECNLGCADVARAVLSTDTFPLNQEAENYCCVGPADATLCGEPATCPNNNWIDFSGLQECNGDTENINGRYCCLGDLETINLPVSYNPVACQEIGTDAIGFSCSENTATRNPYQLYWGMSTGKITNQLPGNFTLYRYPSLSTGNQEVIIYVTESKFLRTNWVGADYLEFDLKIPLVQVRDSSGTIHLSSLEPTNIYIKINDKDYPLGKVNDYLVADKNEVHRIKVSLPEVINGEIIDYSEVQSVGIGTYSPGAPRQLRVAIDNIKLIDEDNSNLLCGYKGFIEDPDLYTTTQEKLAARYACENPGLDSRGSNNPLSWTGTQCCGDDISPPVSSELQMQVKDPDFLNPGTVKSFYSDYFDITPDDGWVLFPDSSDPDFPVIRDGELILSSLGLDYVNFEADQIVNVDLNTPNLVIDMDWRAIAADGSNLEIQLVAYPKNPTSNTDLLWMRNFDQAIPSTLSPSYINKKIEFVAPRYDEIGSIRIRLRKDFGDSSTIRIGRFDIIPEGSTLPNLEYYKDSSSACFAGKEVNSYEIVGNALDNKKYSDILYTDDFKLCDFYNESAHDDLFLTNKYGEQTGQKLISSTSSWCEELDGFTCTGAGWSSQPITFDLEEAMQGFNAGDTVYCYQGELKEPEIRQDWYLNSSGGCFATSCYCPFEECQDSENIVNNCVPNATSVGDRYCEAGTWTTRTAFAAKKIFEKMNLGGSDTSSDGLLSCGTQSDVINRQSSGSFASACFYSNLEEKAVDRVFIMGVPLREGSNAFNNFMTYEFANVFDDVIDGAEFDVVSCIQAMGLGNGGLGECDAGEIGISGEQMTVYYDEEFRIVYVANADVLSDSVWDGFTQFWKDLFNIGEDYPAISYDFDELYVFRNDGNSVNAYTNTYAENGIVVDHRRVDIDFENSADEQELVDFLEESSRATITDNGASKTITWNDKESLWALLTATSRYDFNRE